MEGVSEEFDLVARLPSYGRQMPRLDRVDGVEGASSSRIPLGHRGRRAGAVEAPQYDEDDEGNGKGTVLKQPLPRRQRKRRHELRHLRREPERLDRPRAKKARRPVGPLAR